MHRRHALIGLLAVPILAGAQAPPRDAASASVNEAGASSGMLPAWLNIGGQLRARAEAYYGGGFRPDDSDSYILTRVLLNARVRANRTTSLFVEGMDARGAWKNKAPLGPPFRDHADLRQLYLQLGTDNTALMLRAGRLELGFGDGRLVGSLPWANTARTFDGTRGSYGGTRYRIDAFAASVVKVQQDRFDRNTPGNNFYGVYTTFRTASPKLTAEPFFFWRRQSGVTNESGSPGTMNFGTVGLRALGKLPSNLDYDTQVAAQRGTLGDGSIGAWAGHWLVGRTLANTRLTPRVFAEYNYASGDENPTDNRKGTFDQLYPTAHDKYGLTDLVGWQNMKHVRGGLDFAITGSWSATARYSRYWLANAHDALYSAGGTVLARSPTGVAGADVGREVDIIAAGKLRPTVSFSAGLGYFQPDAFLRNTTPGKPYTYPYLMLTYDF